MWISENTQNVNEPDIKSADVRCWGKHIPKLEIWYYRLWRSGRPKILGNPAGTRWSLMDRWTPDRSSVLLIVALCSWPARVWGSNFGLPSSSANPSQEIIVGSFCIFVSWKYLLIINIDTTVIVLYGMYKKCHLELIISVLYCAFGLITRYTSVL